MRRKHVELKEEPLEENKHPFQAVNYPERLSSMEVPLVEEQPQDDVKHPINPTSSPGLNATRSGQLEEPFMNNESMVKNESQDDVKHPIIPTSSYGLLSIHLDIQGPKKYTLTTPDSDKSNEDLPQTHCAYRLPARWLFQVPSQKPLPFHTILCNQTDIGHCSLAPAQKDKFYPYPANPRKLVELSFELNNSHRGKGIMFEASKKLLQFTAQEWDVDFAYATSECSNVKANKLLQRLMDWSKIEWGGTCNRGDATIRTLMDKDEESYDDDDRRVPWDLDPDQGQVVLTQGYYWLWEIGRHESGRRGLGRSLSKAEELSEKLHKSRANAASLSANP